METKNQKTEKTIAEQMTWLVGSINGNLDRMLECLQSIEYHRKNGSPALDMEDFFKDFYEFERYVKFRNEELWNLMKASLGQGVPSEIHSAIEQLTIKEGQLREYQAAVFKLHHELP